MPDYAAIADNVLIYREAEKILDRFGENKVSFLFLKGIYLAQEVYGDLGSRPMSDVDLLVRETDVRRASDLLAEEGYAPLEDVSKILSRPYTYSLTFERIDQESGRRFYADLHWRFSAATWLVILFSDGMREADVWRDTLEFRVGERAARALSPIPHYIFIALHSFAHAFDKPRMLEDLRRMRQRFQLDERWPEVMRNAREWGFDEIVGYATWVSDDKKPAPLSYKLVKLYKIDRWPCLAFLVLERSWFMKIRHICKLLKLKILREF